MLWMITKTITAATLQPEWSHDHQGEALRGDPAHRDRPVVTIAVALHGMDRLGDRFDEVQERADQRALALDLKFGVTDFNGWQTAYGYDDGASRPRFTRSVRAFRADFAAARKELTDAREARLLREIGVRFDRFMAARRRRLRRAAARRRRAREADLPRARSCACSTRWRSASEELAGYEARGAQATEKAFDDSREDSRRGLIAVGSAPRS